MVYPTLVIFERFAFQFIQFLFQRVELLGRDRQLVSRCFNKRLA